MSASASASATGGEDAYRCPMCEGVSSPTPADCSHCGMALVADVARLSRDAPYVCPMHPEVRQDGPGDCPICGMDLVPEAVDVSPADDLELVAMRRRFFLASALALALLIVAMGPMLGLPVRDWIGEPAARWLEFALATPVVLWAGLPFFQRGWRSLATGNLNMFTLIALGTGTAYAYSSFALLAPGLLPPAFSGEAGPPLYFESAAVIIALVLLGQVLELGAHRRTSGALAELLSLSPPTARVVGTGGETEVPLASVSVGDVLRVLPGDRVPVDGEVLDGRSAVDESMISGEPIPVTKQKGDSVIGGTVNQIGSFSMHAARVGDETVLSQIVAMVALAQRSRAPVQRLVDRVAAVFVPTVVAVAVLAFGVWAWLGPDPALANALMVSVAVLIVACPCALGRATPMSLRVGMGRGANDGVLLKDAGVLEQLERVEVLVIDKTGTLTRGQPTLTEIEAARGRDEVELLRLAASLEQRSEHPLGRALIEAAQGQGLTLESPASFESQTGGGIAGSVGAIQLAIGSRKFLESRHVVALDGLDAKARTLEELGRSVVFVAQDGALAGVMAVSDPIKAGALEAVASLKARNVKIIMLSGDSTRAAAAVAAELGIDEVRGGMSPREKHDRVVALRQQGLVVAMAGDGINDAPALAAADVGIAMGTGTDVAMESAGVTLVKGDLRGIARALALGEGVMRNIRQNLFFAFVYNGLGVPLAAGVLYPTFGLLLNPMIAAAAMSLSSLCVIGNALRLRRLRLD